EMDGFQDREQVFVIASTNADVQNLDPAFLRSGRFDKIFSLTLPTRDQRKEILKTWIQKQHLPIASEKELESILHTIAKDTPGESGAALSNIVNEAAIFAAREKDSEIYLRHFITALERYIFGTRQKHSSTREK